MKSKQNKKMKKVSKNIPKLKNRKVKLCPHCNSKFLKVIQPFESAKISADNGKKIVIKDAFYYKCKNDSCGYTWVPSEEVTRIENLVFAQSWKKLEPNEIRIIREALGFGTKSRASRFLGLNEKAFVKLEKGSYSDLNFSTDLLLRLAVFSKQNFKLIQDLHKKSFQFNICDYEMLCVDEKVWTYKHISKKNEEHQFYPVQSLIGGLVLSQETSQVSSRNINDNLNIRVIKSSNNDPYECGINYTTRMEQ